MPSFPQIHSQMWINVRINDRMTVFYKYLYV